MRRLLGVALRFAFRLVPSRFLPSLIGLLSYGLRVTSHKQTESGVQSRELLKLLLATDNHLYKLISEAAVRYGDGIHPKHRLTHYHDFFVKNIEAGETVLDIGCGIGLVAHDIALLSGADDVVGMDMSTDSIEFAKARCEQPNLHFVVGKAPEAIPERHFDVVVLSNVLEHMDRRREFLQEIVRRVKPKKLLIRVPLFERDWRVPLKKELGINYFSDPTHCVEYTQEQFFEEVGGAGLRVDRYQVRWGEMWAVCIPRVAAGVSGEV